MNTLSISPNVIFEKLIINDNLKLQLELSQKSANLSADKVQFIISVIDLLKNLDSK